MWDANKYSCRKLTGVRLFPSKKITFLGLGFMILHSWSKQYSAIKEGKTQRVWNIIFIPRSEGWFWPKEKRLNVSWRWEESVQVTQASASPALWQCVHLLWREKLQTCWEPTLRTVVPRALQDTSEPVLQCSGTKSCPQSEKLHSLHSSH